MQSITKKMDVKKKTAEMPMMAKFDVIDGNKPNTYMIRHGVIIVNRLPAKTRALRLL